MDAKIEGKEMSEEEKFMEVLGNKESQEMAFLKVSASTMGPKTMELVVKRLQELLQIKMMEVSVRTIKVLKYQRYEYALSFWD